MVCFGFLCIFVQITNTQPLVDDDDERPTQFYDPTFNNYIVRSGRFVNNNPYRLNIPENLYDYYQQNKQYNPDNVQLAKRIIMLPRVGRRSVRSTFEK
jgi:hypothetical protein